MKTIFTFILIAFLIKLSSAQQPGSLDRTFSNDGIVTTDFDNNSDVANAVLILPDNKIIVAGTAYTHKQSFALAKYNTDGTLDVSFGENGKTTSYFKKIFAYTYCAAMQPDEKILVGGSMSSDIPNYGNYFLLIRYKKNGEIDSSFGHNGLDTTILKKHIGGAFRSILIQPDGKIIGVGTSNYVNNDFTIIRYKPNGIIDSSFGNNGIVITDVKDDFCYAGALQNDGKILAGGNIANKFGIIRYNSNGSIDSTFGSNGIVNTKFNLSEQVYPKTMVLQPDGKILMGGNEQNIKLATNDIILARFNSNGTPDNTFGNGGYKLNAFRNIGYCTAMALQPNGKIVLAGNTIPVNKMCFAVARFNKNGSIDSSFDKDGCLANCFPYAAYVNAVAVQPDGKIIAVGEIPPPNCQVCADFGLIRYNGDKVKNEKFKDYKSTIITSPNPAKNILQIEGLPSNQKTKITVIDFAGNMKLQAIANNVASYNINIASLKAGNYLLNIEMDDEVVTKKFMKE